MQTPEGYTPEQARDLARRALAFLDERLAHDPDWTDARPPLTEERRRADDLATAAVVIAERLHDLQPGIRDTATRMAMRAYALGAVYVEGFDPEVWETVYAQAALVAARYAVATGGRS